MHVKRPADVFVKTGIALQFYQSDPCEKPLVRNEAWGILNSLHKLETALILEIWTYILERFQKVSESLHSVETLIEKVNRLYDSLVQYMETLREMCDDYEKKLHYGGGGFGEAVILKGRGKFKVETSFVIIDRLPTELLRRKKAYCVVTSTFSVFSNLSSSSPSEISEHAAKLQVLYENDLEPSFANECVHFSNMIKCSKVTHTPLSMKNLQQTFPIVGIALRMLLCTAVSNFAADSSFSTLKRVKSYLRSTMKEQKLNSLVILHIEADILNGKGFQPVHCLSKVLGLVPSKIKGPTYRPTFLSVCYTTVLISLVCILLTFRLFADWNSNYGLSRVMGVFCCAMVVISALHMVINLLVYLSGKWNHIEDIFSAAAAMDEQFLDMYEASYSEVSRALLVLGVHTLAVTLTAHTLDSLLLRRPWFSILKCMFSLYIPDMHDLFVCFQVIILTTLFRTRFQQLNGRLEALASGWCQVVSHVATPAWLCHHLHRLRMCHAAITALSLAACSAFRLQLLLSMAVNMTSLMVNLVILVGSFSDMWTKSGAELLPLIFIWLMRVLLRIGVLAHCCGSMDEARRDTMALLPRVSLAEGLGPPSSRAGTPLHAAGARAPDIVHCWWFLHSRPPLTLLHPQCCCHLHHCYGAVHDIISLYFPECSGALRVLPNTALYLVLRITRAHIPPLQSLAPSSATGSCLRRPSCWCVLTYKVGLCRGRRCQESSCSSSQPLTPQAGKGSAVTSVRSAVNHSPTHQGERVRHSPMLPRSVQSPFLAFETGGRRFAPESFLVDVGSSNVGCRTMPCDTPGELHGPFPPGRQRVCHLCLEVPGWKQSDVLYG
ncbi:hypothetical protein PR048_009870 [Dryococelus australis]|uniref:HAT C-terminal dimerisation domain-containing protein n=1 Tax=Dryococelus australis TaxID=614101 RepID=A0ABQ9I1J8_9NEOP|nr:hypothetical protein PR048_009870 [Dryococelus australis]